MDLAEAVAENVRALRARRQWQQVELADLLSVSQRAVSTLESGRRTDVGIVELATLCRVFGEPLSELLRGADPAVLRTLGL
jgi:transcriptional regulator with XRE-family HTH domain